MLTTAFTEYLIVPLLLSNELGSVDGSENLKG